MKRLKLFKWQNGRADTGYKLFPFIWSTTFKIDCMLIKYPEGSYIPSHQDKAKNKKHYRINIILKKAKMGGMFRTGGPFKRYCRGRIIFFRPDIQYHNVSKVYLGTRYVLSIGWLLNDKRK